MYVSSRQGYKPPVKSTGRGKKYSHFASLKYCNGAETFYTYDPQRGKAGGQMAHTNTYGTDTGKKFQLANVKDVMGDFDSYGSDPRRIQYAGSETDGLSVDYKGKYTQQLQVIKDNYATFAVPYNGEDNNDYVDGKGFCCNDSSLEAAQTRALARAAKNNFQEGDSYEKMQFYYYPDHLGSSSYITNLNGEVVQHIEYVPFGEVFVEKRNNIWNTPYLFNAKEFDEETGLYYCGARYYDPRLSLWTSVDPLSGIAPNYSGYRYCFDNPTKFVDLLGLFETISQAKEYRAMNGIKGRIPKNEDGTYSINPIHSARFKKKQYNFEPNFPSK